MKRIGIVAGASSGMGREFVYELLRSQKIEELWIIARREERLARLLPQPGFATYAASKAYVLSFSRALGQELKKRKISVTAVCPGPVDTEFFQAAGSPVHPSKKRFMAKPKDVVKKALRDAESKKPVSVYGIPMKLVHLAGKILPTRVVLAVMDRVLANEEE